MHNFFIIFGVLFFGIGLPTFFAGEICAPTPSDGGDNISDEEYAFQKRKLRIERIRMYGVFTLVILLFAIGAAICIANGVTVRAR